MSAASAVTAEGPAQGDVGLALRPEKLRLLREPPPGGGPAVQGSVREVAYYGDVSFVYLDDGQGGTISAALPNIKRDTGSSVAVGDVFWCAWDPEDAVLLTG